MSYARTAAQRAGDFANSKVFEQEVRRHLPSSGLDDRTESVNDFDFFWRPDGVKEGHAWFLDCKEKNQRLTARWHLLPGVPEENLFVLDELSFRKGWLLQKRYNATSFFLLHDVPCGRMFIATVADLALVDRVRRDRVGPKGLPKGKWVIDVSHLRPLVLEQLERTLQSMAAHPEDGWIYSHCLTEGEVLSV